MIKTLNGINPDLIVDCLHLSFSDYMLPMTGTADYWLPRWEAARIDYTLSYGYFQNDKLVGFILHGIDNYDGYRSFFNIGTGVVPDSRGQRIVKQIYNHCIPIFLENNINKGFLEVISSNEKAIKAYTSSGFSIGRTLNSYSGIKLNQTDTFSGTIKNEIDLDKYSKFINHHLSWEQNNQAIMADPDQFSVVEIMHKDIVCAFAIVKNVNQNIVQFGVLDQEWDLYGKALFAFLGSQFEKSRVLNIDSNDEAVISFLEKNEFPELLSQYEMKIDLGK